MSLLFQDNYKKCQCGNKHFFIKPSYALEESTDKLTLIAYFFECTKCSKTFSKTPAEYNKMTLE